VFDDVRALAGPDHDDALAGRVDAAGAARP
jgi:hypothetical protein